MAVVTTIMGELDPFMRFWNRVKIGELTLYNRQLNGRAYKRFEQTG